MSAPQMSDETATALAVVLAGAVAWFAFAVASLAAQVLR